MLWLKKKNAENDRLDYFFICSMNEFGIHFVNLSGKTDWKKFMSSL